MVAHSSRSMNLASAFAAVAAQHPRKAALFLGSAEYPFQDFLDQTNRVCGRLTGAMGLKAGDRVGLWLRNCPEFVPALFGTLQAGGVVVPINNFLKADEVNFILHDAGIDLLLSDASQAQTVPRLQAARPSLRVIWVEDFNATGAPGGAGGDDGLRERLTERDLAVIIYTSGTTGHPKGAVLTHGNLLHNVNSCRVMLGLDERDCAVVVLPMFHSFMLTVGVLAPLLVGGAVLLVEHVQSAKAILHDIVARRATILPAVPQVFRMLLGAAPPPALPLRLCVSGGAPLPRELLREFNARMPVPLLEGYGLSETSPVASVNPPQGPCKAGSIGIPIPGVEMSIQDDAGRILGPGETGEVCIRGGNVMLGYWNQPEETARVLRDGWLLTGDIGHRDADGYFYITDRKKDMLLVNGINVYPREIEEVMYQFPGVKEAAVIGVPDSRKGEQPLAYLACKEGQTVDERQLHQFLRERLADYKLPKHIRTLPALPRNATGKILKTALRTAAQHAGEGPSRQLGKQAE